MKMIFENREEEKQGLMEKKKKPNEISFVWDMIFFLYSWA